MHKPAKTSSLMDAIRILLPGGFFADFHYDLERGVYVCTVWTRDKADRKFVNESRIARETIECGSDSAIILLVKRMIEDTVAAVETKGAQTIFCSHAAGSSPNCAACGRVIPSGRTQRCAFVDPTSGEVIRWIEDEPATVEPDRSSSSEPWYLPMQPEHHPKAQLLPELEKLEKATGGALARYRNAQMKMLIDQGMSGEQAKKEVDRQHGLVDKMLGWSRLLGM